MVKQYTPIAAAAQTSGQTSNCSRDCMATKKKTVVKKTVKRVVVPAPVVATKKATQRLRMPQLGDTVTDLKVEKHSVLVGTPRAVVTPGNMPRRKQRA
jgi:hypothetical protein